MIPLLETKLKKKLLVYLFTHSDENFYVRELAGLIGQDPGNLSRELKKLENDGLCRSLLKGKSRYYSLNKAYPLFKELKTIVFKTEGVQGSLRELMNAFDGVTIALLYGSYSKARETKTSDIDLIVVGEFDRSQLTRRVRQLESKLGREINFTVYLPKEFNKERQKSGGFLDLVLQKKPIVLKGSLP